MRATAALLILSLLGGCMSTAHLPTVDHVDLPKFMGDWYVLAHVPAGAEREAYDAIESYQLESDGTIATTYTFRVGGFDGPIKTLRPKGFVYDRQTNAEWKMQFIWPFRAEYLITYLDETYTQTIIARRKRDYVWIMARTPQIPQEQLQALIDRVVAMGYERSKVREVPQRPPSGG